MELPVKIVTAVKFTYPAPSNVGQIFSNLDLSINIVVAYIKVQKHDIYANEIMK